MSRSLKSKLQFPIFIQQYSEELYQTEELRLMTKKHIRARILLFSLVCTGLFISMGLLFSFGFNLLPFFLFLGIAALLVGRKHFIPTYQNYELAFKTVIFNNYLKEYYPQLNYYFRGNYSESILQKSHLSETGIENLEDTFIGQIEDLQVHISLIKLMGDGKKIIAHISNIHPACNWDFWKNKARITTQIKTIQQKLSCTIDFNQPNDQHELYFMIHLNSDVLQVDALEKAYNQAHLESFFEEINVILEFVEIFAQELRSK